MNKILIGGGSTLDVLTSLAIIIVIGILLSIISKRLGLPNVLLLIIGGIGLGILTEYTNWITLDPNSLVTLATLALVLIVFYGSSRFEFKSVNSLSTPALKLTSMSIFLNILLAGTAFVLLVLGSFSIQAVLFGIIFAVIASGTDPASLFTMMKNKTSKVVEFLEIEAILNTPIIVLLPFIFLDIYNQISDKAVFSIDTYIGGFFTQILVGIGAGIFVGIIFFKSMRRFYSDEISPLAIISAALLSYILAENLGGNGVLAVAVVGLVFGNIYISHKNVLQDFSGMLSNALEIMVYLLLGFMVELNLSFYVIFVSLGLFALLIVSRYLSARMTLKKDYTDKEIMNISLNLPKGIAVAVLVFTLTVTGIEELIIMNQYVILIMIYSIILSTVHSFIRSKKFAKN